MAGDHPLPHAHRQYSGKDLLENGFRKELSGPAYRTVPGKLLVDILADKVENVHTHGAMADQLSVAYDVLQIADQAEFEEHHRIDALPAAIHSTPW